MAPENTTRQGKFSGRNPRRHRTGCARRLALLLAFFMMIWEGAAAKAEAETGNRTVKAGIFHFDGYHMKDEEGNLSGYGIEFLNLAAEYSHLNFQYVEYDKSWNDMLTMLDEGQIDVVTSGRKTEEWEEKFET